MEFPLSSQFILFGDTLVILGGYDDGVWWLFKWERIILIRKAKIPDLDQVIHLLYDDGLGGDRESISNKYRQKYLSVFSELLESKYFDIFVMEKIMKLLDFIKLCICHI